MSIIKSFFYDNFRRPVPSSSSSKPRIEFIDLAKGVCILLVVFFHMGYGADTPALRPMRMPLYFILSGLFFKDYGGFANFFFKKLNKVLVPFCFFFAIGLALKSSSDTFVNNVLQPFYEADMVDLPIWFLLGLFWVNLIYFGINRWCRHFAAKCMSVALCGACGYLCFRQNIYLPLFLASSLSAMPFFFTGILLGKLPILYNTDKDKYFYALLLPLFVCAIAYCWLRYTPYIAFRSNLYIGRFIAIYVISVAMVTGLLMLCKLIRWLPVISYFGRYSIMTLGLHCIFQGIVYLPFYWTCGIFITKGQTTVLTLLLCWLAIPVMRRWLPKFTAQADLIKRPSRPLTAEA